MTAKVEIVIDIYESGKLAQLLPADQAVGNIDVNPGQAGFVHDLLYAAQARIIGINGRAGEFGPLAVV
jgi:hypothetical protein